MQPYLQHFGVKGMKWGVRRSKSKSDTVKKKKQLTINDNGQFTISNKPASKKGIKNFTMRMIVSMSFLSASMYMSKHPQQILKGMDAVNKILNK